jgi:hypothetical protein
MGLVSGAHFLPGRSAAGTWPWCLPGLAAPHAHADNKTTLTHYTDVDDVLEEAILKA